MRKPLFVQDLGKADVGGGCGPAPGRRGPAKAGQGRDNAAQHAVFVPDAVPGQQGRVAAVALHLPPDDGVVIGRPPSQNSRRRGAGAALPGPGGRWARWGKFISATHMGMASNPACGASGAKPGLRPDRPPQWNLCRAGPEWK